jgi:hypothetical protein
MARGIEGSVLIIGEISIQPGCIGLGKAIELFAGINTNPVHNDEQNRTARRILRGIHIVVILQNFHSILFILNYK